MCDKKSMSFDGAERSGARFGGRPQGGRYRRQAGTLARRRRRGGHLPPVELARRLCGSDGGRPHSAAAVAPAFSGLRHEAATRGDVKQTAPGMYRGPLTKAAAMSQ